MRKYLNSIVIIIIFGLPFTSFALATDSSQPIYFQSDNASINRKTGIGIFNGHVEFTQGTTIVKGNKMIIYQNKQKQFEKVSVIGNPASYQTISELNKPILLSVAHMINYFPQKNLAEFIGDAQTTLGIDSITGPQINYDVNQNIMTVPFSNTGRTKIILNPKQK